ncbi:MAG: sodium:solute symporter [Bacteroidales bacterium]|nr:sodium:solute symporter [Bacteroidales bacterium]
MNGLYILLTILVYFGLLLVVSHFTGKNADNDTFFRGNRNSPWYLVAFGMIGASLSGVTFVSVPGMVRYIDMTYMQTCLGFYFGYLVIAQVLLPLYYRLNLTSIYTYLKTRFGRCTYKTGASFFLVSKMVSAAARLYLVAIILQQFVFENLHIPFGMTIIGILVLIWLYTRKSGIKAIVWTDSFQTLCMLVSLVLIIWQVGHLLHLDLAGMVRTIREHPYSRIFEWSDWHSTQHFVKQFVSGIFITIVMTGLDQDMMQKNLSCRTLKESQKNMYWYGLAFVPVNLLFLSLGILLTVLAGEMGMDLPAKGDEMLPLFAAGGYLGYGVLVSFTIGIIAAAFSSADSALTALTTSCCIDLLETDKMSRERAEKTRKRIHLAITAVFILFILLFKALDNSSIIDALFTIVSYTYGPLLGLYAYGLFTRRATQDRYVPYIAIASPIICYVINQLTVSLWNYKFGYELLMFNGLLTFMGLWLLNFNQKKTETYGN